MTTDVMTADGGNGAAPDGSALEDELYFFYVVVKVDQIRDDGAAPTR